MLGLTPANREPALARRIRHLACLATDSVTFSESERAWPQRRAGREWRALSGSPNAADEPFSGVAFGSAPWSTLRLYDPCDGRAMHGRWCLALSTRSGAESDRMRGGVDQTAATTRGPISAAFCSVARPRRTVQSARGEPRAIFGFSGGTLAGWAPDFDPDTPSRPCRVVQRLPGVLRLITVRSRFIAPLLAVAKRGQRNFAERGHYCFGLTTEADFLDLDGRNKGY
jgi:hypothetical protein